MPYREHFCKYHFRFFNSVFSFLLKHFTFRISIVPDCAKSGSGFSKFRNGVVNPLFQFPRFTAPVSVLLCRGQGNPNPSCLSYNRGGTSSTRKHVLQIFGGSNLQVKWQTKIKMIKKRPSRKIWWLQSIRWLEKFPIVS